jgi:hypothetical protein
MKGEEKLNDEKKKIERKKTRARDRSIFFDAGTEKTRYSERPVPRVFPKEIN